MRRHLAGMTILLASCAGAAAGPVVWEGTAYLTAMTEATAGACTSSGWRVGQHALAVVQPKVVNAPSTNDMFILNFSRPAAWFKVTGVSAASITKVDIRYIFGGGGFQIADAVTLGSSTITPALANITTSTPTVTLQLVAPNWYNQAGCTVTIRGTFAKRPV